MESEYSLLCSQEPATGPYLEAVKYSSFLKYYFFKIHINIILRSALLYIRQLWSSGQSSWLQIQRSGFDFRYYQIFWEVVSLERNHSASWVQLWSYFYEKVAARV
jgi:hypothetical protein